MKNKILKNSGFSLLEVMAAIFIVIIGLIGIMSLITFVTASASAGSSKLIAANLAQEGVEIVRNIRDLEYLKDNDGDGQPDFTWDVWYGRFSGILRCYNYSQYDTMELLNPVMMCFGDTPVLKYDSASGLYGFTKPDGSNMTQDSKLAFRRKIAIKRIGDEMQVSVTVSWVDHGRSQSLTVEDRLWKWR